MTSRPVKRRSLTLVRSEHLSLQADADAAVRAVVLAACYVFGDPLCIHHGIIAHTRTLEHVEARLVVYYVLLRKLKVPVTRCRNVLQRRHGPIIYGANKVAARVASDAVFSRTVTRVHAEYAYIVSQRKPLDLSKTCAWAKKSSYKPKEAA